MHHGQADLPVLHWDTARGTPTVGHQYAGGSEPVVSLCRLMRVLPLMPPAPQLLSGAPGSRKRLHLPWLQPCGNELSALSWSCSSLYSQWREMGDLSLCPCHEELCSPLQAAQGAKGVQLHWSPPLNACSWVGRKSASTPIKSRIGGRAHGDGTHPLSA